MMRCVFQAPLLKQEFQKKEWVGKVEEKTLQAEVSEFWVFRGLEIDAVQSQPKPEARDEGNERSSVGV